METEIIDVDVLWNYLPEGDYIAKLLENETNILEHILEKDIDENEWETFLKVYNHPENSYCIQGSCIFRNIKTNEIIETTETTVVENKGIEYVKNSIEETQCIKVINKLERI